jgi:DNA-binding transcriptional LysR family regulator
LHFSFLEIEKVDMDKLRAMELFVATADRGSFSAAGRLYGLSPASVSRHINELEDSLGVTLIHRSTRALTLTESGESYMRDARDILASLKAAETAVSEQNEKPRGLLRVHSRTMFGVSVLSRLQPAFSDLYPDLVVDLHLSERAVRPREDGFDLDFRIAPPAEHGLVRRKLFLSRRILVAAPDYLSRTPEIARPGDLMRHACLTYWISHERVYWRFRQEESDEELSVPSAFSSNNGLVLLDMALAGRGIALLDDYTVAGHIASGALVEVLPHLRVTNTTFEEGIFVAYTEAPFIPVKLRLYIDFVVDHWGDALRQGRDRGGMA